MALKRMIITQTLHPGDQVNVAQLSAELSFGRTPIHLAIHRLEREGLLDVLPRKGILVKAETLDSFLELMAARLLIEPWLTGQAVERASGELVEKLDALLTQGREHQRNQDRQGSMQVDRLFHQTLYAHAGNDILAEFAGSLLDRSMRLWFRPAMPIVDNPTVAELEDLLDTVRRGDKNEAIRRMEAHISSIRSRFLA